MALTIMHNDYKTQSYILIRGFVSASQIGGFKAQAALLPEHRVMCGIPNVTWIEQKVPDSSSLYSFFSSDDIISFIHSITGEVRQPSEIAVWVSKYSKDEYINRHKDKGGSCQLLVCLEAPSIENGGLLMLNVQGEEVAVHLSAGDAVLFEATSIEHYTTPLQPSLKDCNPKRAVLVGRYYF